MQQKLVHYVEDNIIQCELMNEQKILVITNKSIVIMRYDAKKQGSTYQKISIQIPFDHNVEAAQIFKRHNYFFIIAAIRIQNQPKLYFSYIQCADGRIINSTQIIRQYSLIINQQINLILNNSFITALFISNNEAFEWQIDQINFKSLNLQKKDFYNNELHPYDICRQEYDKLFNQAVGIDKEYTEPAYSIISGIFLNRQCLFVGYEDYVSVYSIIEQLILIAKLKCQGIAVNIIYHSALHQIVVLTDQNVVLFYHIDVSQIKADNMSNNLIIQPNWQFRVPCNTITTCKNGYLLGNIYGQVFFLENYKSEIRFYQQQIEQDESISYKEYIHTFEQENQQEDQFDYKQIQRVATGFPTILKLKSVQQVLSANVIILHSNYNLKNMQHIFIAASRHGFVQCTLEENNKFNGGHLYTMGLDLQSFNQFINTKMVFDHVDQQYLNQEIMLVQNQLSFEYQIKLIKQMVQHLGTDVFQIIQEYLAFLCDKSVIQQRYSNNKEEITHYQKYQENTWVQVFASSKTYEEDLDTFINVIQSVPSNNFYHQQQNLGITQHVADILPFIGPMIVQLQMCYNKGGINMSEVIYKLLPQLKSVSESIHFYMKNTMQQIIDHNNAKIQFLINALDKNLYMYANKSIDSYSINPMMAKPLYQGTVRKYAMDQLKVSNWLNNYFNYNQLKSQIWENFRQIAYTFNGIKDYYDVLLKRRYEEVKRQYIQEFQQEARKGAFFSLQHKQFVFQLRQVSQTFLPIQAVNQEIIEMLSKTLINVFYTPMMPGVIYQGVDLSTVQKVHCMALPQTIQSIEKQKLQEIEQFNKQFNFQFMQLLEMYTINSSNNEDINKIESEINKDQEHILKNVDALSGKVQNIFIFELNENCISIGGLLKYLIQSVYNIQYYTEKQFNQIRKQIPILLSRGCYVTFQIIIYNLLKCIKYIDKKQHDTKSFLIQLNNIFINYKTLQIYTIPTWLFPFMLSMQKEFLGIEFTTVFISPDQLLGLNNSSSYSWNIGVLSIVLLSLFIIYDDEYNMQKNEIEIALWEQKQQYYQNLISEQQQKRQAKIYQHFEQSSSQEEQTIEIIDEDMDIIELIGPKPEVYTKKSSKLITDFNQFFKQLAQHTNTTNTILKENDQLQQKDKLKFNVLSSNKSLSEEQIKLHFTILQLQADMSYDLISFPSKEYASNLLSSYLNAQNPQLANFLLENSIINPFYKKEKQQSKYRAMIFQETSENIKQIIGQLFLSKKQLADFEEFLQHTLVFDYKKRYEHQQLLKLHIFKHTSGQIKEIESKFNFDQGVQSFIQEKQQHDVQILFSQRSWRNKTGHQFNLVKKTLKKAIWQPEKQIINSQEFDELNIKLQLQAQNTVNIEQLQQIQEVEQQRYELYQRLENDQFQNEQAQISLVKEIEEVCKQQFVLNQLSEIQFDYDESEPSEQVDRMMNSKFVGQAQTYDSVFNNGKVILKKQNDEIAQEYNNQYFEFAKKEENETKDKSNDEEQAIYDPVVYDNEVNYYQDYQQYNDQQYYDYENYQDNEQYDYQYDNMYNEDEQGDYIITQ